MPSQDDSFAQPRQRSTGRAQRERYCTGDDSFPLPLVDILCINKRIHALNNTKIPLLGQLSSLRKCSRRYRRLPVERGETLGESQPAERQVREG